MTVAVHPERTARVSSHIDREAIENGVWQELDREIVKNPKLPSGIDGGTLKQGMSTASDHIAAVRAFPIGPTYPLLLPLMPEGPRAYMSKGVPLLLTKTSKKSAKHGEVQPRDITCEGARLRTTRAPEIGNHVQSSRLEMLPWSP